ncbi:MAG: type VII toxin-antitoxin system HepT family RNase toxin [Candidatus Brocadia sp.]
MSPIEREIIRRKLAIITENLNALELIKDISRDEYIKDIYKRKATERLLQELIEVAIDINTHVIVQTCDTAPDDYYESFIKLGDLRVITPNIAKKLAPSAGLRNRLVHEYDLLEHSLVLDAVRMAEELYPEYVKEIETFISGGI